MLSIKDDEIAASRWQYAVMGIKCAPRVLLVELAKTSPPKQTKAKTRTSLENSQADDAESAQEIIRGLRCMNAAVCNQTPERRR